MVCCFVKEERRINNKGLITSAVEASNADWISCFPIESNSEAAFAFEQGAAVIRELSWSEYQFIIVNGHTVHTQEDTVTAEISEPSSSSTDGIDFVLITNRAALTSDQVSVAIIGEG